MTAATAPSSVSAFTGSPAEWDAFVRSQPNWTHFHLYGWRQVMEEALGHECLSLVCHGPDGAPAGVLPLVRVKSVLFGHFLVSMPFVNYGGPLGTPAAVEALAREAASRARRDKVKLLELRSRESLPLDLSVSHRKITVVLDIPAAGRQALWDGLPGKLRSQVRRPQKEGVEVRFGRDQLDPFYHVFCRHMRDLGTPVLSRRLFQRIADVFPDDAWFGCAWFEGQPVAGGCGFHWGREFEITWASSLREHNRIAPNMLLYWAFMERCVERGVATFNFGRCTPGSGTHRFKSQWGSRDVQLYWYQVAAAADATPSPDQEKYKLAARVWSRLPLGLANRLGPHIVRFIP